MTNNLPPLLAGYAQLDTSLYHQRRSPYLHHPRAPNPPPEWPDDESAWVAFEHPGLNLFGSTTTPYTPTKATTCSLTTSTSVSANGKAELSAAHALVASSPSPSGSSTHGGGFRPEYAAIIIVVFLLAGGLAALLVYRFKSKKYDVRSNVEPLPPLKPGPYHFSGPLDRTPSSTPQGSKHDPFGSSETIVADPNLQRRRAWDEASTNATSSWFLRLHRALHGNSDSANEPLVGMGRGLKGEYESTDAYTFLPEVVSPKKRERLQQAGTLPATGPAPDSVPMITGSRFTTQASAPGSHETLAPPKSARTVSTPSTPLRGKAAWEERVKALAVEQPRQTSMAGIGAKSTPRSSEDQPPRSALAVIQGAPAPSKLEPMLDNPWPKSDLSSPTVAPPSPSAPSAPTPSVHMHPGAEAQTGSTQMMDVGSQIESQCVAPSVWPASTTGHTASANPSRFQRSGPSRASAPARAMATPSQASAMASRPAGQRPAPMSEPARYVKPPTSVWSAPTYTTQVPPTQADRSSPSVAPVTVRGTAPLTGPRQMPSPERKPVQFSPSSSIPRSSPVQPGWSYTPPASYRGSAPIAVGQQMSPQRKLLASSSGPSLSGSRVSSIRNSYQRTAPTASPRTGRPAAVAASTVTPNPTLAPAATAVPPSTRPVIPASRSVPSPSRAPASSEYRSSQGLPSPDLSEPSVPATHRGTPYGPHATPPRTASYHPVLSREATTKKPQLFPANQRLSQALDELRRPQGPPMALTAEALAMATNSNQY